MYIVSSGLSDLTEEIELNKEFQIFVTNFRLIYEGRSTDQRNSKTMSAYKLPFLHYVLMYSFSAQWWNTHRSWV